MSRALRQVGEKLEGTAENHRKLKLWLRLLTCTIKVENLISTRLREQFSTTLPRFDVMAALSRAEEDLTMGELSKWLLVSNGNVTGADVGDHFRNKKGIKPWGSISFCKIKGLGLKGI